MRWTLALALLAGCAPGAGGWDERFEPPPGTAQVIEAAAALPACAELARGGVITWHAGEFMCGQTLAQGCAWPARRPAEIHVLVGFPPESPLAHELCHLCSRDGDPEATAEACAAQVRLRLGVLDLPAPPPGPYQAAARWSERFAPPREVARVIEAVERMPECVAVRAGGELTWRTGPFTCRGALATSCSDVGGEVTRVSVLGRCDRAQDTRLAHELCHVCGYQDDLEAEACAFRANHLPP